MNSERNTMPPHFRCSFLPLLLSSSVVGCARPVRHSRGGKSLRPGNLIRLVMALLTCLAASAERPALAEDWPCWRGPRRDGIARETGLLKKWPQSGPQQLWQAELSGGFSSVAVADSQVFTQTKQKNQEVVVCLDAATGKDVWRYSYGPRQKICYTGLPSRQCWLTTEGCRKQSTRPTKSGSGRSRPCRGACQSLMSPKPTRSTVRPSTAGSLDTARWALRRDWHAFTVVVAPANFRR
jgi:hypothetical protein